MRGSLSTSAAPRRDAERAGHKVKVPNLALTAFLSLKSIDIKAYLKVRLGIQAQAGFPPILNPSPQARTDRCSDPKIGSKMFLGTFFRFFALPTCNPNFASKKLRKKCENRGFWLPKTLPKSFQNRCPKKHVNFESFSTIFSINLIARNLKNVDFP